MFSQWKIRRTSSSPEMTSSFGGHSPSVFSPVSLLTSQRPAQTRRTPYFSISAIIFSYISGSIQSSLSTKERYSPVAASIPAFRALLRPPFFL